MSRICKTLVLAGLSALVIATACSCNGGNSETTPADTDPITTPPVADTTEAPAEKVDVTLTVQDQDGKPMTEAVITILPVSGESEGESYTTDESGKVNASLDAGAYTVRFDVLPEYVLGIDTEITVTAGMDPVVLGVTDNSPNGSEERPFVINEDTVSATIPAGTTYTYTLFGANNRTVTVQNANLEITFKGTTYTPDENGEISFRVTADSPREHVFFSVTNKGTDAVETTVTLTSDPGAMDNPIVIEILGENVSANVPKDGMVYYKWTATTTGHLTVSSSDSINNISLNNLTTSQVTDFTQGSESATISITEGDVITIVVSTVGGDRNAEFQTVTFMLTLT